MNKIEDWINDVLKEDLPKSIVAINFNLYQEKDNQYAMEMIGSSNFDLEDSDWVCDETYATRDRLFKWESKSTW